MRGGLIQYVDAGGCGAPSLQFAAARPPRLPLTSFTSGGPARAEDVLQALKDLDFEEGKQPLEPRVQRKGISKDAWRTMEEEVAARHAERDLAERLQGPGPRPELMVAGVRRPIRQRMEPMEPGPQAPAPATPRQPQQRRHKRPCREPGAPPPPPVIPRLPPGFWEEAQSRPGGVTPTQPATLRITWSPDPPVGLCDPGEIFNLKNYVLELYKTLGAGAACKREVEEADFALNDVQMEFDPYGRPKCHSPHWRDLASASMNKLRACATQVQRSADLTQEDINAVGTAAAELEQEQLHARLNTNAYHLPAPEEPPPPLPPPMSPEQRVQREVFRQIHEGTEELRLPLCKSEEEEMAEEEAVFRSPENRLRVRNPPRVEPFIQEPDLGPWVAPGSPPSLIHSGVPCALVLPPLGLAALKDAGRLVRQPRWTGISPPAWPPSEFL